MIVDSNTNSGLRMVILTWSNFLRILIYSPPDPFSDEFTPVSPVEVLPNYAARRSQTLPIMPSTERHIPSRPPTYSVPRPSQPQIYTFTTWSTDTTLLLPPSTARNRSPLYRISVELNLNPFAPLSYVTTVRRGGDVDGEIVVTLGNHSTRMSSILTNFDRSPPPRTIWRWKHNKIDFRWDCRNTLDDGLPMCICLDSNKLQLASFVPPPLDAPPPAPDATLTVFPDGHQYFDDILLSSLVIARKITLSF
ncbi:hypothetical protein EIP91_007169 [Steccherinum ochraceum]|uniref:Uncharacterized protein n=1 Tax=Steccherinum ochraceum TaxID=92696 RepID=A0A4R0RT52_9APHY|nr:hypothetical protein EIP91_007169 [Steccherinum ochraceum]